MRQTRTQVIVATHGDLAGALLRTVESIAGPQQDLFSLPLQAGEDIEAYTSRLRQQVREADNSLILVDMPGGTPWNVALGVAAQFPSVRVVGGVNLPMLLEVALSPYRTDIEQLVRQAVEAGSLGVKAGRV